MADERSFAIGLDLGTGGARAVAVDLNGRIAAEGRASFDVAATVVDGPRVEQSPEAWRHAACQALLQLTTSLPARSEIVGLAVDATSGTFLLVDRNNRPLTPGLMYNDQRATDVAVEVAETMDGVLAPFGIHVAPAFALPKIVHLARKQPKMFSECHQVVHQTDWIVGMLTGRFDVTDISSALKTGADPGRLGWPAEIEQLGVPLSKLPKVVLPGMPIGRVTREAEAATGVKSGTPVLAGCTDGTAGCLASGACQVGDLNVTLGTTLVFKAIAEQPLIDPAGALYNHRHPAGGFLPGAASSTGAEWVEKSFDRSELEALGAASRSFLPTNQIVYPLVKTGERFPFSNPDATGFGLDAIEDPAERLAAGMEAVAMLERMAIERLEYLGLPIGPTVFATGGGVANETWLEIRAAANRRRYSVPEHPECAIGAAILGATDYIGSCKEAIKNIVRTGRQIQPNEALASAYDESYCRFQETLKQRGWC